MNELNSKKEKKNKKIEMLKDDSIQEYKVQSNTATATKIP